MTKRVYSIDGQVAPGICVATKTRKKQKKTTTKKKLYDVGKILGAVEIKKIVKNFKIGEHCRVPLKQLPRKAVVDAGLKAALEQNEVVLAKVIDVDQRSRVLSFNDERLGTLKVSARVLLENRNMEVESLPDSNSESDSDSNSDSESGSASNSDSSSAHSHDESEEGLF
jgi:hypothetical protein